MLDTGAMVSRQPQMNNSVLHYWRLVFLIGQSQSEMPLRGVSSGRLLGKGSAMSSASTGRRSTITSARKVKFACAPDTLALRASQKGGPHHVQP